MFQKELDHMMKSEFKVELESVYCHGIDFFSREYLRNKLYHYCLESTLC